MFVGHYAASFVAKAYEPRASLAALFIAAQLLDLIFFPLVLFNVEQLAVATDMNTAGHLAMPYMPYSHSIYAALVWSLLSFIVCKSVFKLSRTVSILITLVIASHWLFDWLTHTPDLAVLRIFSDTAVKWGLGLNNFKYLAFAVELAFLFGAAFLYLRRSEPVMFLGHICTPVMLLILLTLSGINSFSEPLSQSPDTTSVQACILFITLAVLAVTVDRSRRGS